MAGSTKIAVIGGGPGGYVAAIRAARLGADVTLIERGALGGTCLNAGCIPTKALLQSAHLLNEIRDAGEFGITAEPSFDFGRIQQRKQRIVKRLVTGVSGLLKSNGITVINGECRFRDAHTLVVRGCEETELAPDKIIIAAGSMPSKIPIPGANSPRCIDSTAALAFDSPPASMAIIGGGVVGVELASVYSSFGTRVTVIEAEGEILPNMDAELAAILRKVLGKRGVKFFTAARVESICDTSGGLTLNLSAGGEKTALDAEYALISVGRRADTEPLALDAAGVKHEKGRILAGSSMRTNQPHIYAIGDCLGQIMLAHTASAQGETAAGNAMGGDAKYSGDAVPFCVYTDPEFASAGLTEKEAASRGLRFRAGKFPLIANGKSLIANRKEGVVKVITDEDRGTVLGLHILGPHATDMIAEGVLAVQLSLTADDIAGAIHPHPTVSEAVREAALAAAGMAAHL